MKRFPLGAALALLATVLLATLSGCSTQRSAVSLAPEAAAASAPPTAVARPAATSGAGRVQVVQWPILRIDNREFRAAPGARIINTSNNLMMTANQIPPNALVSFELDGMGQVRLLRVLPPGAAPADGQVRAPCGTPRAGPQ
jgi:hypothetical protein